ncbi:MAG: protoheme IX farnesyltransferase [Bacteroidales bacterium]|nr:protoheme IX farnesyltransferase [Bacteroidales bacterium]
MIKRSEKIFHGIQAYFALVKIRITSAVALSTMLGYLLAAHILSWDLAGPVIGIFLLACAAAALNQVQEKDVDSLMPRTALRPIPSEKISIKNALVFVVTLSLLSIYFLYTSGGCVLVVLSALAMIFYNAMYTPLKRITPFAVIPGSFIGAIPPMVGWVAAGGSIMDLEIILVAFFFIMWQIPHFWLLLLKNGGQYSKAGLPVLTDVFSIASLSRISFVWVMMSVAAALFLPFFGYIDSILLRVLLLISSLVLVSLCSPLVTRPGLIVTKKYFIAINFYLLVVMVVLILNSVIE